MVEEVQSEEIRSLLITPNDCASSPLKEELVQQGFLIDESRDELDDVKSWYSMYTQDDRLIHLTILPAEACNFGCPYCFQYNKRSLFMDDSIYGGIYRWIKKIAANNRDGTVLRLSWFGGEPTLAMEKMVEFMTRLRTLGDEHNVRIESFITTNGYLLTKDAFLRLLGCGITDYQITLDGDAANHDRLRTLKNGAPTFDVIYRNLLDISALDPSNDFAMVIRANFLKTSMDSMDRLLDRYKTDFGDDRRFRIYFRPVYNFHTTREDIKSVESSICSLDEGLLLQDEMALKVMRNLEQEAYGRIFDPLPTPTASWCPSERKHSYIIGADGKVFACDTYIGDEVARLGTITPDGTIVLDKENLWKRPIFDEPDKYDDCLKCKLLPLCMGGCPRIRIQGKKACYWKEADIYRGMKQYADLYAK